MEPLTIVDDFFTLSELLDSGADLLLYGMGERSIIAMAEGLKSGISIKDLTYIDGTVYKTKDPDSVYDGIMLPSFEDICASKETYARSFYNAILQLPIRLPQNV